MSDGDEELLEPEPAYVGRASVPVPSEEPLPVRPAAIDDRAVKPPVKPPLTREAKRKRERRRRLLAAAIAVFIMLSGVGVIVATYFYDKVITPSELTLQNSTEIYSADGAQIARLGNTNRTEIAMDKLPEPVRNALIAGEDKNFYTHDGIDLWGIGRAAWNNLTGGELQGASTITQQYARHAANDMDVTFARKLREAVMARKLEDEYEKIEILGFYLNTVYFGRGAYGIAAAAEAYFGIPPDKVGTLTVEQAAVLGAVLKQPEPDGDDKGFDPQNNLGPAKDRWAYVLNNMVEMTWLSQADRDKMAYPPFQSYDPAKQPGSWGYTDRGTGYVVEYVEAELTKRGVIKYLNDNRLGNWKNAGLRITTSIDARVQAAMEAQLNRDIPGSSLSQQRPNIVGAGVAIDPKTGRVLAYYGGTNNGTQTDWAGKDAPHPPASSYKIYTLAAAIADGISIQSHWDSRELKIENGDAVNLTNSNREGDPTCVDYCTLEQMTILSFNVPFYELTSEIGSQKVMQMAANAGVRTAWGTDAGNDKSIDLTKGVPGGRSPFDFYAGIGQYPITVLDHASGTATFANRGSYNEPHFVLKVERKNRKTGTWEHLAIGDEKLAAKQTVNQAVADEVTGVLKQIPKNDSVSGNGRDSAGKTGTWENGLKKADGKTPVYPNTNAHAWFTGYTSQISATFWIGSSDYNTTPIKTPGGGNIGSSYPRQLWKKFMDKAHLDLKLPGTRLAAARGVGNVERGTGQSPTPGPSPGCENGCPTTPNPTPTPKPTSLPTVLPLPTGSRKPGLG